MVLVVPVWAQLSDADIAVLQAQAEREGWAFTVGRNPATERPLEELCGLIIPDRWWVGARFDPCLPRRDLPAAFDWRDECTLPPIRDQDGCGSCWAFGTVGPLECNIAIKDGVIADLSEQWLVSCNSDGWSCNGGFFAHDYHQWKTDPCAGTGAVPESAFPYVAWDAPCNCPYPHDYLLTDWAYVGNDWSVPPVANIKQAILDHGPVSVAVYVNSAFQGYNGGIFGLNGAGCGGGSCNHAVTLVGWDDNGGSNGYWIMRNSWGPGWGEGGYMNITYNCSSVGYAACYVVYPGTAGMNVTPETNLNVTGPVGGPFDPSSIVYTLENGGGLPVNYTVSHTAPWLSITNSSGTLAGHGTVEVTVSINSAADSLTEGRYTDTINFTNLTNHRGDTTRAVRLQIGMPICMFTCNMDSDPGWATQGEWAFGQPTGQGGSNGFPDPACGCTGMNVYGVNLNGDYSPVYGGPYYLTLGPLNFASAKDAVVSFKRWLNTDYQPYVYAMVEASPDGSSWATLWTNGTKIIKEQAWTAWALDLPATLNNQPAVYVRWGYRISNGAWAYSGWNIDDVEIWAFGPPPVLLGDMNCDGVLNFGDINPFVLALTNPAAYAAAFPGCDINHADINGDGYVDFGDINPFVGLMIGP
jgi:hypothetical protein